MLSRILRYTEKSKKTIDNFKKHSQYMVPGRYIVNANLRFIYRDDLETFNTMNRIIFKNNYKLTEARSLSYLVKRLIVKKYIEIGEVESSLDYSFSGVIYLLSNSSEMERDVKVFNFKTMEVLSIYKDREHLKKKISDYKRYSPYFLIPNIKYFDLDKNITVEELIESIPSNDWTDSQHIAAFDYILKTYDNYYRTLYSKSSSGVEHIRPIVFLNKLLGDSHLGELTFFISQRIESLSELNFPMTPQHGDLWTYNLMLSVDGDMYIIDWEHSGEYIFFYDIFWWIHYKAMYENDYTYIDSYMSGKYDNHLISIFNSLNMDYNKSLRDEYYLIFLIELLYKRILEKSVVMDMELQDKFKYIVMRITGGDG